MIEATDPVNYSALDALKSVLGGDFPELIRDFRAQSSSTLVKIELALAQLDREAIAALAHVLKGSALSLHAKPLAAICRELEVLSVSADRNTLDAAVQNVHTAVREVISAIEEWAYR